MPPATELLVSNFGNIASAFVLLSVSGFALIKSRGATSLFLFLTAISCSTFLISHVAGTNVSDPYLSRNILMLNLSNIFIVLFTMGTLFAAIGKLKQYKNWLVGFSLAGLALFVFFVTFPNAYLLPSRPILYFPNYYVGGPLYFLQLIYFFGGVAVALFYSLRYYLKSSYLERNRIKYFILMIVIGYGLGSLDYLPLYGVPFDPIASIFLGVCMIPPVYGIVYSNLMDINIVAKRALTYAAAVALSSIFIIGVNTFNNLIIAADPAYPYWLIPVASSAVGIVVAVYIWKKLRETELMRYEFINVVTHKFRTPLTYIKWASDSMEHDRGEANVKKSLETIKNGVFSLVELTDTLVGTVEEDKGNLIYRWERCFIRPLVHEVLAGLKDGIEKKSIRLSVDEKGELKPVYADKKRLSFVIQTLLENAINYSPAGGPVRVLIAQEGKHQTFSVSDNGIGISKENLPLVFSEFFRSKSATAADTGGLGVGLYLSKEIVKRHGGHVWAGSKGEGKGSTFHFKLKTLR